MEARKQTYADRSVAWLGDSSLNVIGQRTRTGVLQSPGPVTIPAVDGYLVEEERAHDPTGRWRIRDRTSSLQGLSPKQRSAPVVQLDRDRPFERPLGHQQADPRFRHILDAVP